MIIVRRVIRSQPSALFSVAGMVAGMAGVGIAGAAGNHLWRQTSAARSTEEYLNKNQGVKRTVFTLLAPEAAIGVTLGHMYSRRRKTKSGKVVIERVRRKKKIIKNS